MRISVELPQDQVKALDRLSEEDRRACEAVIQAAVADYLEEDRKRRRAAMDAAFGIWKDLDIDGLEYQERMRAEWDRDPAARYGRCLTVTSSSTCSKDYRRREPRWLVTRASG